MLRIDKGPATIDPINQAQVDAVLLAKGVRAWKSKSDPVEIFKDVIMTHGMVAQSKRCAWCTLAVGLEARRTPHRDHIAPQSLHPEWTFTAENLLIACEACNGFQIKGDVDTVAVKGLTYAATTFHAFHPYRDVVSNHVEFISEFFGTGVSIRAIDAKGQWTIDALQLHSPGMTKQRAQDVMYAKSIRHLPARFARLLVRATGRAP